MTDEQIEVMVNMHRHMIKHEIRQGLITLGAEIGKASFSDANTQEERNNRDWDDFVKWFKMIRDK